MIYRTRYGYSRRDAIRAEFWWRLEHVGGGGRIGHWLRYDGRPLAPLARYAYGRRKAAERRGALRSAAR